ncbi:RING-box protein 1 [Artemisia annua]|uniref:RING-box protein 1 n=1 Tax=Artemisia annua TaxID=35608 RepID=A0A2U1KR96_ARTAN|nr:RING-box protein 1 [Artemisia annua]
MASSMDTDVPMVTMKEEPSSSSSGAVAKKESVSRSKSGTLFLFGLGISWNHIMDLCIECQANQASATL